MRRAYAILIDQKGVLQDFENLSEENREAARIALNYAADRARTRSAAAVRSQLALPARYVSPSEGRLTVSARATNSDLQATVSAQARPTSLARFVSKKHKPYIPHDAKVEIKPGVARYIRNARFVKLRQGSGTTDTNFNMGLAIRTKNGQRPSGAYRPVQMRNGMWLLYGPSVSQALLSLRDTGIWPDMTEEVLNNIMREYYRQLDLRNV